MENNHSKPKKMGRPLSFDRDLALRKAMLLFWQHGYESTSIADLTTAMGVTPPSIYTAFGNKKTLFLEAVALYAGSVDDMERSMFDAPTAYEAAQSMLMASAIAFTNDETPKGCLLASATSSVSEQSTDVQRVVVGMRSDICGRLAKRIEKDIADGILPESASSRSLATLVITVIQGMSVLARDGVSQNELVGLVATSMQAWPKMRISS
jgi:AcrR family transcriptional regulator